MKRMFIPTLLLLYTITAFGMSEDQEKEFKAKKANDARNGLINWIKYRYPYNIVDFVWDEAIELFQRHGGKLSEPLENGRTALELAEHVKNWPIFSHIKKAVKRENLDPQHKELQAHIIFGSKTSHAQHFPRKNYQHGCSKTFMAFALHDFQENGGRLTPPDDPYDSEEEYGTGLLQLAHNCGNKPAIKMLEKAIEEEQEEAGKKEAASSQEE